MEVLTFIPIEYSKCRCRQGRDRRTALQIVSRTVAHTGARKRTPRSACTRAPGKPLVYSMAYEVYRECTAPRVSHGFPRALPRPTPSRDSPGQSEDDSTVAIPRSTRTQAEPRVPPEPLFDFKGRLRVPATTPICRAGCAECARHRFDRRAQRRRRGKGSAQPFKGARPELRFVP